MVYPVASHGFHSTIPDNIRPFDQASPCYPPLTPLALEAIEGATAHTTVSAASFGVAEKEWLSIQDFYQTVECTLSILSGTECFHKEDTGLARDLIYVPDVGMLIADAQDPYLGFSFQTGAKYYLNDEVLEPLDDEILNDTLLPPDYLRRIQQFIKAHQSEWDLFLIPQHFRKEDFKLARSIVYIPGEGPFILLKSKGGFKPIYLSVFKNVKLAYSLEKKRFFAFGTSVSPVSIPENEKAAFRTFCNSEYFIGGHTVEYPSAQSERKTGFMMPYAEAGSLNDISPHISETHRLKLLLHVAKGLKIMHDAGWVHGDVKPENILLLNWDDKPRITDFGFSYRLQPGTRSRGEGTLAYAPPEVYCRGYQDFRSDVYSFGVMLAALTGPRKVDFLGKEHDVLIRMDYKKDNRSKTSREEYDLAGKRLKGQSLPLNYIKVIQDPFLHDGKDNSGLLFLDCCQPNPDSRPMMDTVIERLERIINSST